MKAFVVLATLVVAATACSLPSLPEAGHRPELPGSGNRPELPGSGNRPELPGSGHRPELLPPSVDPIHPSLPDPDPIHPSLPEVDPIHPERPLPPGISPEVPIAPPRPTPPLITAPVHSEILNFPSNEDPQVRVHVNIKQDMAGTFPAHRVARAILNWPGIIWPGLKPNLPEAGNKPEVPEGGNRPEIPEGGNKPEIPEGGNKPEIMPPMVLPPTDDIHTYIYPNVQHQLVKLRVQYNKEANLPPMTPYKIDFPGFGNKPALPESGNKPEVSPPISLPEGPGTNPIFPMPMPPIGQKVPQVEIFLDIGEQENIF